MRARSLAFGAALAVASTTVPTVANASTPAPITSPGQTAPQQSAPSATSFRTTARTPSGGTALLGRSCTGFASNVTPPRTIRVYRTAYGRVDVVNFNTYVKNSLPREWITSWKTESLKAGAMAVKTYAWYRTLHWKGGSAGGVCYDLRDDTADQVYRPGSALAVTNAAVDATWGTRMTKNGVIFQASYCSNMRCDYSGDSCGAATTGVRLSQWGSQRCAQLGWGYRRILSRYYYSGLGFGSI